MRPLIPLLILVVLVAGIIFAIRRFSGTRTAEPSSDLDLIAYGLLAIAVGVAVFSLAALVGAAFVTDTIVGDGGQQVATSLAGLVVSAPISVFLWRRQALRRRTYPDSAGWPVYLAVIEAVFMTAAVITGVGVVSRLIGSSDSGQWSNLIIFGGVVALHDLALARTPAGSDAAGLPRVVGSAVGLITTAIGVGALLYWVFDSIYDSFVATAGDLDLGDAFSFIIVGAPVWYYRWWRRWSFEPKGPRKVWLIITSVSGLYTALGAAVAIAISLVVYAFGDPAPAGEHFEFLPVALSVMIVAVAVWLLHRPRIGAERSNTLRSYEYIMTALALAFLIGSTTALAAVAFGEFELVGPRDASVPLSIVVVIVVSLAAWWWFWSRAQAASREIEAKATPRRVYLLGMGIITGLTAAQALIATLVIVFQQLLDVGGSSDILAVQGPLFVVSGLATWHLLRVNVQDKKLFEAEDVIAPFNVMVICSHPGPLATAFPKQAALRVFYRADEVGVVDDQMAADIAAQVGEQSSLVWVRGDGFEVAPARFG